jgi:ornithine cyclodeaminase/alanine dehydrogenase-like protein (mu-crystallin family)
MRFYSAEQLRKVADLESLVAALEAAHRIRKPEVADSLIGPERSRYLVRSAHDGDSILGSKLVTIVPENPSKRGVAAVQALIVLFAAETGTPEAVLDATELTYWKTAADSALGAKLLSREDARTLCIAGAGGLAPWLVRGHLAVRSDISQVLVWNRTLERADALVQVLRDEGIPAETSNELEAGVREADIISTATMAREPILRGEWLKPGAHVDLVGGYAPDTREADDGVFARGALFVDCRESALEWVGDILGPIAGGIITEEDIRGDLFDLVRAKASPRADPQQITVFKNAGGAHLDLMIAQALIGRLEGSES